MIHSNRYPVNFVVMRLFILIAAIANNQVTGIAQQYILSDNSSVILKGSSTVNTFTCACLEEWPVLSPVLQPGDNQVAFSNANLIIAIKNLDCGNRMMNKDLQSTLHADKYPTITVSLMTATGTGLGLINGAWQTLQAQLKIQLNGQENAYWTVINAKKIDDHNIQFRGTLNLKMTDFKIVPPRPFLGMIVVHDEMEVALDLYIHRVN